jgi:quercetin dioxygenase-like cupin family protein
MEIRRVITGAIEGRGVFTADETVAAVSLPLVGNQIVRLWGFDKPPQTPAPGRPQDPKTTFFPPPGAVRAVLWTAPPAAAVGLHTTATSDLQLVLEGEIELVLESGERRTLRAGDVAVVNGIPHAWRNETSERCLVLAVFYGGRPEERS